ncbi:hypothetical protein [Photobacterium frigidiphilum]|uniref:hypothetical protein n=1 Tax=Photobacterium frigidiphilum TaxID=264736 RepID=UPI001881699F|nr:hypothetical protein [Photobacterium frigidiphilum]
MKKNKVSTNTIDDYDSNLKAGFYLKVRSRAAGEARGYSFSGIKSRQVKSHYIYVMLRAIDMKTPTTCFHYYKVKPSWAFF